MALTWYFIKIEKPCLLYRSPLSSVVCLSLRADDVLRFEVFDHRHGCSIARIGWSEDASDVEFGNPVLSTGAAKALEKRIELCRLC